MQILYKLLAAIVLGVVMLFSAMLMIVFATFIIGFIAQQLNLNQLADAMFNIQKHVWSKTKQWFNRFFRFGKNSAQK